MMKSTLWAGAALGAAIGVVACSSAPPKTACLALARRIGDAPRPISEAGLQGDEAAQTQVRVIATSQDFEDGRGELSGPPEFVFVALPPDEDETAERSERTLELPQGRYRVERLKVEEFTPEIAPAAPGDPSRDNPEWSLDLIDYRGALDALDAERRRTGRPSLAELPPGSDGGDPVVIGHPDTGYTFHRALGQFPFGPLRPGRSAARVRPAEGYGFRDCTCSTFDLEVEGLVHGLRDPRHGTATSSLIVGQGARTDPATVQVRGIAPGADLMPLRVATGVIVGEARGFQMAMAVRHAALGAGLNEGYDAARWSDECIRRAEGGRRGGARGSLTARPAQVLSISMGAPASIMGRALPTLEKAMLMAERRGVIVVAAAGQGAERGIEKIFVKFAHGDSVAYPGAFDGVIGVAASNIHGLPWKATFRGEPVDVSAPGELVWNAKYKPLDDGRLAEIVETGKGTSFSTAITAGVAALWVDYHGRAELTRRFGTDAAIPSAFKYVLVRSGFNTPDELCALAERRALPYASLVCASKGQPWDTARFGVGHLDARKVLTAPLPTRDELCGFVKNGIGPEGRWKRRPEEAAAICPAA